MMRAINLWLPAYLRQPAWKPVEGQVTDLLISVCDHFEPYHDTDKTGAMERMHLWRDTYPRQTADLRDADGCTPKHSFFYPIEQYDADVFGELEKICRSTRSEVEIHLHHHNDTEAGLRAAIAQGKRDYDQHGMLSRGQDGQAYYGFIHGNWALDNSHPEGRNCGINNELTILADTGCFADFTMPSAPHPTQTRTVNRIYYAQDTPAPKSHEYGDRAKVGVTAGRNKQPGSLLLVQGPLGLNWERRKFGLLPRIENADLTGANPPRMDRLRLWQRCGVHIEGRPEWLFIKLHTHGAIPRNSDMLLGEPMRVFHQQLLAQANEGKRFRVHYVTAREMVNIIHAAEAGKSGNAGEYRDFHYSRPPVLQN